MSDGNIGGPPNPADPQNLKIEPHLDRVSTAPRKEGVPPRPTATRNRFLGMAAAIAAIGGFAGIAWYATSEGQKDATATVPVIEAEKTPVKIRPDKPGGLEIPNQDKQVFARINPDDGTARVERLLPPPETPMAKPAEEEKPAASTAISPAPKTETPPAPPAGPLVPEAPALRPEIPAPKDDPAPIERVQKESAPKPASKPAVKTNKAAFRIQLGAVRSIKRAEAEAKRMNGIYGKILGDAKVAPVRADLGKKGVFYRLRAGPFASQTLAAAACVKLIARKANCIVIKP